MSISSIGGNGSSGYYGAAGNWAAAPSPFAAALGLSGDSSAYAGPGAAAGMPNSTANLANGRPASPTANQPQQTILGMSPMQCMAAALATTAAGAAIICTIIAGTRRGGWLNTTPVPKAEATPTVAATETHPQASQTENVPAAAARENVASSAQDRAQMLPKAQASTAAPAPAATPLRRSPSMSSISSDSEGDETLGHHCDDDDDDDDDC